MTAGLSGSGTEVDPWLITSQPEFWTVVRDSAASGFYRVVAELHAGSFITLAAIPVSPASLYQPKVIDLNGYEARISSAGSSQVTALLTRIQFRRGSIRLSASGTSSEMTLFYRCGMEDVAVYLQLGGLNSARFGLMITEVGAQGLAPMVLRRVVFLNGGAPAAPLSWAFTPSINIGGLALTDVFANSAYLNWVSAGLVNLQGHTLQRLDTVAGGRFSENSWWQSGDYVMPYQADQIALTVQTRGSEGQVVPRSLWVEFDGALLFLGYTDVEGAGQYLLRVRKHSSFVLIASEDMTASVVRAYMSILAGARFIAPGNSGFIYRAGESGQLGSLDGIVWAGEPVTTNGITFTPLARHRSIMSNRVSALDGESQSFALTAAEGGGGPIIDGDPAFLDGVVEEIHPLLGTVRPLANAEVSVFERRGPDFVPMGSAFSNALGEFRVDTEVYGGGDVLAVATDFPGVIWAPGVLLSLGDRVRPTADNGYVYEIVVAGTSGTFEPDWWADAGDGTEGFIGTARAKARPYYQPQAHGPLKMTLIT